MSHFRRLFQTVVPVIFVVPNNDQFTTVNQCVKLSHRWIFLKNIQLNVNMRFKKIQKIFLIGSTNLTYKNCQTLILTRML